MEERWKSGSTTSFKRSRIAKRCSFRNGLKDLLTFNVGKDEFLTPVKGIST